LQGIHWVYQEEVKRIVRGQFLTKIGIRCVIPPMPHYHPRLVTTFATLYLIYFATGYNWCQCDGWHLQVPAGILRSRLQQAAPTVRRSRLQAQDAYTWSGT